MWELFLKRSPTIWIGVLLFVLEVRLAVSSSRSSAFYYCLSFGLTTSLGFAWRGRSLSRIFTYFTILSLKSPYKTMVWPSFCSSKSNDLWSTEGFLVFYLLRRYIEALGTCFFSPARFYRRLLFIFFAIFAWWTLEANNDQSKSSSTVFNAEGTYILFFLSFLLLSMMMLGCL